MFLWALRLLKAITNGRADIPHRLAGDRGLSRQTFRELPPCRMYHRHFFRRHIEMANDLVS